MDVKTKENIEHTITISNIEAPRPSSRKKKEDSKDTKNKKIEAKDDPHAWPSREFLRHLTIGKTVTFIIEYRGEYGKEFGSVIVHTKNGDEDCAKLIVKEGWAGVKKGKTSPEIEELLLLEEQALKDGKGMHRPNGLVRKGAVWEIDDLFEKLKGKPQNGVVEGVRSGHQMRIALLPDYREVQVFLSGIRCPDVKPDGSYVEPFGREARLVAEYFCLNKDVTLILESFDKMSLYGTVICDGKNIAEAILEQGLGNYVEWSAKKGQTQKLQQAEKSAKEKKLRLWSPNAPVVQQPQREGMQTQDVSKGTKKEFFGIVTEIVNAGVIMVTEENNKNPQTHKIYLSSIVVPKMGKPEFKEKEKKRQKKKLLSLLNQLFHLIQKKKKIPTNQLKIKKEQTTKF